MPTDQPPIVCTDTPIQDGSDDDEAYPPPNSVTYAHPLVSPYHAPRSHQTSDSANSTRREKTSPTTSPFTLHTASPARSFDSSPLSSSVSEAIECELFDWSGPLPRVPFYEDASRNVKNLYSNPRAHETVVWVGLSCCLDALLYCFSFLPFKIAIALFAWIRIALRRVWKCHKVTSEPTLQPKHVHALLQGLIIVIALIGVNTLIEYVNINTYSTISKITWVKLYVLFNFFAIFDLILERVGKRMTGYMQYIVVSGQGSRVYIVLATSIYVLLHCLILICQISTIHSAVDNGAEVLGVLINVKLTDLKDGFRTSLDQESLFKLSLQDVANRFKWIVFLVMICLQKLLRLYAMPTIADLHQLQSTWAWIPTSVEWLNRNLLSSHALLQLASIDFWTVNASWILSSMRVFMWEMIVGIFSPQMSAALASDAVYVLPAISPPAVTAHKSPFTLFISKPPAFVPTAPGATSIDPSLLLVDALSVLPVWLPTFLYSACVTFFIVCLIDYVKHATLALFNPDWLTPRIYKSYQKRLSSFFLLAPKLGLGDQKSSSFALAHFDFMSLPLTVIIVRELWMMSVAVVNSCAWGAMWLHILGRNVIVEPIVRQRCAIWYQQILFANLSTSSTPLHATTPALTNVSPLLKAHWLDGDPMAHFALAAWLLFAFRLVMFLAMCCSKVLIRLILRAYAKRHHDRIDHPVVDVDGGSESDVSPSPQPSPSTGHKRRSKKARRDLETNMASPIKGTRLDMREASDTTPAANGAAAATGTSTVTGVRSLKHRKQVSISDTVQVHDAAPPELTHGEGESTRAHDRTRTRHEHANPTSMSHLHDVSDPDPSDADAAASDDDDYSDSARTLKLRKSLSLLAILKHAIK